MESIRLAEQHPASALVSPTFHPVVAAVEEVAVGVAYVARHCQQLRPGIDHSDKVVSYGPG